MNDPSTPASKSITDSPWYWVYLFCTAGAVALLLAGPKFATRQAQIERNSEARQHAAQHVANQPVKVAEQQAERRTTTRITLWPLYFVLGCVLLVAWFNLWRRHKQGHSALDSSSPQSKATA